MVGLTLDEKGIPETAEGRFAIAERILEKALSLGIPREDVIIDCLTLTGVRTAEGGRRDIEGCQTGEGNIRP